MKMIAASNSQYYLKFIPNNMAGYEFGPVIEGGDNAVTKKRGNSKQQTIKNGERYEVNAGLVAKKGPLFSMDASGLMAMQIAKSTMKRRVCKAVSRSGSIATARLPAARKYSKRLSRIM